MITLLKVTTPIFKRYLDQVMGIERVSFPSPWTRQSFLEEIENPISNFWLAREGDEVVGSICFWMFRGEIHLMNVAVRPMDRGKGIGAYMIRQMIDFGVHHHVEKIWLEVRPSNLIALRLYEKLGFKEVGRRRKYYTDTNEDAIVMALEVNSFEKSYKYYNVVAFQQSGSLELS